MEKLGQIVKIDRERIRPFAGQPREYFDETALNDLARSIKAVGQQVPITVRRLPRPAGKHLFELVDGQRRWLACGIAKVATMIAWIAGEMIEPEDQFLSSVIANFARAEHTPMEIAKAIARIRKRPEIARIESRQKQTEAIADIFGKSFGWVYQFEKLLRLAPALQRRVGRNQLGTRIAEHLALLPEEEQLKCFEFMSEREYDRDQQVACARRWQKRQRLTGSGHKAPDRTQYSVRSAITKMTEASAALIGLDADELAAAILKLSEGDRAAMLRRIGSLIEHLTKLKQVATRVALSRRAA